MDKLEEELLETLQGNAFVCTVIAGENLCLEFPLTQGLMAYALTESFELTIAQFPLKKHIELAEDFIQRSVKELT